MLTFEDLFIQPTYMKGYLNRVPVPSVAMSEAFGMGMMAEGTVDAPEPNSPGAAYEIFDGTRTMAKGRAIDVRPNPITPRGVRTKVVKPLHFAESMPFHFNRMRGARTMGQPIGSTDNGASYIRENLAIMKQRFASAFEFMWVRTLLDGFKYETTENNDYILREFSYNGGDAITVVTNEIPATHKDQIALGVGGTDIIDEPWTDPAADLFGQFMRLNVAIARESGYPIGEIWMNGNTAVPLFRNTSIRQLIGNQAILFNQLDEQNQSLKNPLQAQSFRLNGLPGIRFVIYNGVVTVGDHDNLTYEQIISEEYSTLLIPDGRVIMTPPRETVREWAGFVPVKRDIVETGKREVHRPGVVGFDTYSYLFDHPAGQMTENSGGGLPFIRLPRAVFSPTVDFV